MPLALGFIALLLFVVAIKGNYDEAGKLFNQTFFKYGESPGFLLWAGSIFGLSIIFRLIGAPNAGRAFIGLLVLVYFLTHNNVLQQLNDAAKGAASSGSGG